MKSVKFSVEKEETKLLCACKQSKTAPFCDKSHIREIPGFIISKITGK